MGIRQEEFADCVGQYERLVLTVCLSFTGNWFDAEDLAQESFLAAYRHLDAFDGRNMKAWLTAIAANKCRDYLRRPARRRENLTPDDLDCLADPAPTPQEGAESRETREVLHRCCGRLREPYRAVALWYFYRGGGLGELARQTGENIKTLETRLRRAKKLLRALWEEEYGGQ